MIIILVQVRMALMMSCYRTTKKRMKARQSLQQSLVTKLLFLSIEIEEKFNIGTRHPQGLASAGSIQLLYQLGPAFTLHTPDSTDILDRLIVDSQISPSLVYLGPSFSTSRQIYSLFSRNSTDRSKYKLLSRSIADIHTDRPFVGMNPSVDSALRFDSAFEGGNLDLVEKITENEYNLFMRVDTNSRGHQNWFNFSVQGARAKQTVKFHICNFTKKNMLYSRVIYIILTKGHETFYLKQRSIQKTVVIQIYSPHRNQVGYSQQGVKVTFHQSSANSHIYHKKYYQLSFEYSFEYDNDEVHFALLPPYTYTYLLNAIRNWRRKLKFAENGNFCLVQTVLCKSLLGLDIPLLTITDLKDGLPLTERRTFIISARIHPSESNSSWMVHGFISFILSDNKLAVFLRKMLIFKIVPMLNPDGVVVGNYRNSLAGQDLNRKFLSKDLTLFPEVKALQDLISRSSLLTGFIDLHGHSQRKFIFAYGPALDKSQESKLYPSILQTLTPNFRFRSCQFGITEEKESTARAFANNFVKYFCYTIEASYYGTQTQEFNDQQWRQMGEKLVEGIHIFVNLPAVIPLPLEKINPMRLKRTKQSMVIKQRDSNRGTHKQPIQNKYLTQLREKTCSSDEDTNNQHPKDEDSDAELDEDFDLTYLLILQNGLKTQMKVHEESAPPSRNGSPFLVYESKPVEEDISKTISTARQPKATQTPRKPLPLNRYYQDAIRRKIPQQQRPQLRPHIVCDHYDVSHRLNQTMDVRQQQSKLENTYSLFKNKAFDSRSPSPRTLPRLPQERSPQVKMLFDALSANYVQFLHEIQKSLNLILMSVYSGFCTRKQEKDYNFCLQKMMFILAKRCVKAIHNIPVDATRFAAYFGKLFGMMIRLEEGKYQPPKFSDSLWELADAMGIRDLDNMFSENQSQMMESSSYFHKPSSNPLRPQQYSQGKKLFEPERQNNQPNSQRSRRLINKSQDDQHNTNESGQNDPSSLPPRLTKNYVINYKYYYNNSPSHNIPTIPSSQPKRISPVKQDHYINQKIPRIPPAPQTHYNYMQPPITQSAQPQNQQRKQIHSTETRRVFPPNTFPVEQDLDDRVQQSNMSQFVRVNQLPDSRSLHEREQEFLRKFENSRGVTQRPLNNIDEENESQPFSNQSPQKLALGNQIIQRDPALQFDNPEAEESNDSNLFYQ